MKSAASSWLRRATVILTCLATGAAGVMVAGPAHALHRATPGSFTGFGFDHCDAPTQSAMDAWLTSSPYWAVGIYISGDSRGCPSQPNLTPAWVSMQLRHGWKLLPLTVGPQASCTTRERYLKQIRISPDSTTSYAQARKQGSMEAAKTVRAAESLGISAGSTLWYDIEAFDIGRPSCRESAISFLSTWTNRLHALGYVSGVYSSAASGIRMLDDANVETPGNYSMPDRIWIADWNGKADIYSSYVRSSSWMPHRRVHQYRGGHPETYGGMRINVDSNFMSLGRGSVPPASRVSCGVGIDLPDYHRLVQGDTGEDVKALKCLLSRKGTYHGRMRGFFGHRTVRAVAKYQEAHRLKVTGAASLRTWTAILSEGAKPVLKYGSASYDVRRLQRTVNAAVDAHLPITGLYDADTAAAVRKYQKARGLPRTGVVAADTWDQLQLGNR